MEARHGYPIHKPPVRLHRAPACAVLIGIAVCLLSLGYRCTIQRLQPLALIRTDPIYLHQHSSLVARSASDAHAMIVSYNPPVDLRHDATFWISYAQKFAEVKGVHVSETCNQKVGTDLLKTFADAKNTICGGGPGSASLVECMAYPGTGKGVGCVSNNMILNIEAFMGSGPAKGTGGHQPYLPASAEGSVQLACKFNESGASWQQGKAGERPKWFTKAYKEVDYSEVQKKCAAGPSIRHPVLFITRLDPTNPYHHTQTLVHAFLTLAAHAVNNHTFPELQVMIADHYGVGNFMDVWKRLSHPHPVIFLNQYARSGQTICFKQGVHAHYTDTDQGFVGEGSFTAMVSCPSVLLLAVAHWLRYIFMLNLPYAQPLHHPHAAVAAEQARMLSVTAKHHRLSVLYISRTWFERSMKAGGGLNTWQQQRAIEPDKEQLILQGLQKAVFNWNMQACVPPVFGWWQTPTSKPSQQGCKKTNVSFDFQAAEVSLLDLYPTQVELFTRTAVLVAGHGAALTNMIFMQPLVGAVVEIYVDGWNHYLNQAHMLGHRHIRATSEPASLAKAVTEAMNHVASKY